MVGVRVADLTLTLTLGDLTLTRTLALTRTLSLPLALALPLAPRVGDDHTRAHLEAHLVRGRARVRVRVGVGVRVRVRVRVRVSRGSSAPQLR